MHIEKGLCYSILGALLNMGEKSKEHLNSRFGLQEIFSTDKEKFKVKASIFYMTKREKKYSAQGM